MKNKRFQQHTHTHTHKMTLVVNFPCMFIWECFYHLYPHVDTEVVDSMKVSSFEFDEQIICI